MKAIKEIMHNHSKSNFGILNEQNKLVPRWYMPFVVGGGALLVGIAGSLFLGIGLLWTGYKIVEVLFRKGLT